MAGRRDPSWTELLIWLLIIYASWTDKNGRVAPSFWYDTHVIAIKIRRAGIRLEQYAHRKYLESVMH